MENKEIPFLTEGKKIGQWIVVGSGGFVYVGDVTETEGIVLIEGAKNIRKWGTTSGLGELRNGPTKNTVVDYVGKVRAFKQSIHHMIKCKGF